MSEQVDLNKTLLKGVTAYRMPGGEFQPLDADVIAMLGNTLRSVAISCKSKAWPELFELMSQHEQSTDSLMEEIRLAHNAVSNLLLWINDPEKKPGVEDQDIYVALERVGWNDVPIAGKVAYLNMLGLKQIAMVWATGRKMHLLGLAETATLERVADAAGEVMRMYDQRTNTVADANRTLKSAVQYALLCGLMPEDVRTAVGAAVASFDDTQGFDAKHLYRSTSVDAEGE